MNLKILIIADIHGDFEKLTEVLKNLKNNYDLVICPGDFTDMFNLPPDFSQLDVADLIIQKLLVLKKPLFCIPGNHDPYEILDLFDEYGINLHNQIKEFKGINFLGFGGAATPFNTIFEPSENETKESLVVLADKLKKPFILITHMPAIDTKLDLLSSGKHVGSKVIREFILNKKPILAISAHIHEANGKDKLNSTTLFYPGTINEGYGVVEIKNNKVECRVIK